MQDYRVCVSGIRKCARVLAESQFFSHQNVAFAGGSWTEIFCCCSDVVIFHPKRLQNKFEENQLKYSDDAVLHKMKSWVTDNM